MGKHQGSTGTTEIRECCTFEWSENVSGCRRLIYIGSHHCFECVTELRRSSAELGVVLVEIPLPDDGRTSGVG